MNLKSGAVPNPSAPTTSQATLRGKQNNTGTCRSIPVPYLVCSARCALRAPCKTCAEGGEGSFASHGRDEQDGRWSPFPLLFQQYPCSNAAFTYRTSIQYTIPAPSPVEYHSPARSPSPSSLRFSVQPLVHPCRFTAFVTAPMVKRRFSHPFSTCLSETHSPV